MSKDINYYFAPREEPCKDCGSTEFDYHVCNEGKMVMWVCRNCGMSESVPHIENYTRKRCGVSSLFERWSRSVIARDMHVCRICGSREKLEAHHIIPVEFCDGTFLATDERNGITLCERCHRMVHGGCGINVTKGDKS